MSLRLPSLALTQSLCLGPPCPRQLHFQSARGVTHGTPKRRRRMWRNRSSCTWAFAKGTDWTTTPEFGHEDERTWAARFALLMFAAPHPPQRAGMQAEVGPVNRSCLGYDAGDCLACVWVAGGVAFSDGFVWCSPEHVPT